jgi:dolichol-phosphate mannosyltransferase
MLTNKLISAVVVCYGDEGNIRALYERLSKALSNITDHWEIIYVNDASPDNSEIILQELAAKDQHLTLINQSRNFGAQAAFTAGMVQALGDAVVLMDGDLQDPPELIEEFVKKWIEGNQVVYGVRRKREKSMGKIKEWMYHQFYVWFAKTSYISVPQDAGEFSLMDRVVVDHMNALPERDRFLRGLRAWVGYKSCGVPYVRPERFDGRPSVSTKGLISAFRWARKAIFSFSYKPLEWVTYAAVWTALLAVVGIIVYVGFFFFTDAPRGLSTVFVLILFFAAIQLSMLAIMGEYIGRIFEEVKGRPRYITRDIVNDHRLDSRDLL